MKHQTTPLPRTVFLRFYGALSTLLTPVWRWALRRRLHKGKETPTSIAQRWVTQPPARPQGVLLWGHAVGVGESLALAGLMRRIGNERPDLHFLLTTTARTSQQALSRQQLDARFTHQFMPVDTPKTVAKFLNHWQPDVAMWCELDLWPALIDATHQRDIPMFLVNARFSEKSFAKKRHARFFYRPILQRFTALWSQNSASTQALIALGADANNIHQTGTIKGFNAPLAVDGEQLALWQAISEKRPIWLLASSHAPEEALALQAHAIVRQTYPNALLIIAPRVPQDGNTIHALCSEKYSETEVLQRSQSARLPTTEAVYIADTMGELGLWYRLARVAMVGGSWAEIGGHNPFEATACGCLVLHGKHTHNFSESYEQLNASQQALLCPDVRSIAENVTECLRRYADNYNQKQQDVLSVPAMDSALQSLLTQLPPPVKKELRKIKSV